MNVNLYYKNYGAVSCFFFWINNGQDLFAFGPAQKALEKKDARDCPIRHDLLQVNTKIRAEKRSCLYGAHRTSEKDIH